MITPRFWCTQDHSFVILKMRLVHVKTNDVQFVVDGARVTFSATPYYLRLTFDQQIIENEDAKATYDVDSEIMTVLIPKLNKGEVFTDLDCTTKLLTTTKERKKLVEELNPDTPADDEESEESSDLDYELKQEAASDPPPAHAGGFYGFNHEYAGFFAETRGEIFCTEMDIDATPVGERIEAMRGGEAEKFLTTGCDQYVADLQDPSQIKLILQGQLYPTSCHTTTPFGNPTAGETEPGTADGAKPPYYLPTAAPPSFDYLCSLGEPGAGPRCGAAPLIQELPDGDEGMEDSGSEEAPQTAPTPAPDAPAPTPTPTPAEQQPGGAPPAAFQNPSDIGRSSLATGGGLSGYLMTREEYQSRQQGGGEEGANPEWGAERDDVAVDLAAPSGAGDREEMPPHPSKWRDGEGLSAWEREEMLRLPKKRYLVTNEAESMCGLMDLLACFCYDLLTTDLEGSSESVWTITKLSPTLSYCVPLPSVRHVVICFIRRALTFPLYRHIALARRCLWDVAHILSQGNKVLIVRILLRIKWHLDRDEFKHPLSKLYVAPYATWVQSVSPDTLQKWGSALAACLASTPKEMLGLPLDEIEALAAEQE